MSPLDPHTPVIVGIGFHQERNDDPTQCAEPYQLMVRAVRNAAADAGSPGAARRSSSRSPFRRACGSTAIPAS